MSMTMRQRGVFHDPSECSIPHCMTCERAVYALSCSECGEPLDVDLAFDPDDEDADLCDDCIDAAHAAFPTGWDASEYQFLRAEVG